MLNKKCPTVTVGLTMLFAAMLVLGASVVGAQLVHLDPGMEADVAHANQAVVTPIVDKPAPVYGYVLIKVRQRSY
jgi:hypothetical protein